MNEVYLKAHRMIDTALHPYQLEAAIKYARFASNQNKITESEYNFLISVYQQKIRNFEMQWIV